MNLIKGSKMVVKVVNRSKIKEVKDVLAGVGRDDLVKVLSNESDYAESVLMPLIQGKNEVKSIAITEIDKRGSVVSEINNPEVGIVGGGIISFRGSDSEIRFQYKSIKDIEVKRNEIYLTTPGGAEIRIVCKNNVDLGG